MEETFFSAISKYGMKSISTGIFIVETRDSGGGIFSTTVAGATGCIVAQELKKTIKIITEILAFIYIKISNSLITI